MQEKRISGNTAILMVLVAFAIDLLQIALDLLAGIGIIANRLVDILALGFFWLWFRSKKVSFTKTRAIIFFGLAIAEMLPGVDAFPLWIIDVLAVIITVSMEDRLGINAETIVNDPRLGKVLKKGIVKSVNAVANQSGTIKNRLNEAGWPENTNSGALGDSKRNPNNLPLTNPTREEKIKAQQTRKSNANQ
jgi:hypothetical protein